MALSSAQKRFLKGMAHHLDPVVLVGQHGITEAVTAKVGRDLGHHELIKVRVGRDAPVKAKEAAAGLAQAVGAELVQVIGHMVVLYKPHPDPKERGIVLPA